MEHEPRRFQGWNSTGHNPEKPIQGWGLGSIPTNIVASTEGQVVEELQVFEPPVDFTDLTGKVWRLGGQSYDPKHPDRKFYQYFIPTHPTPDNPHISGMQFKTFPEGYIQDVLREQEKERSKFGNGA